jgi:hypothetical protein
MQVVDAPRPRDAALCDEAISRYADAVKSRAISVYRVDSALLVITAHIAMDNRFFFSAWERLPSRYHHCFPHEPYILPAWSLRVIQHAAHTSRELVAGRDVIAPYAPADGRNERWCRTLESYCACAVFYDAVTRSQLLNGRRMMEVARALLPDAGHEAGEEQIRATWDRFCGAFERFDRTMRELFGVSNTANAVAKARNCIAGNEEIEQLDREYAFCRARDIDGYHQELASLGFPYGHLFPLEAYPNAVRAMPSKPFVDSVVSQMYRLRKRLSEYAAAPDPA